MTEIEALKKENEHLQEIISLLKTNTTLMYELMLIERNSIANTQRELEKLSAIERTIWFKIFFRNERMK